jgi:hypothetical protein
MAVEESRLLQVSTFTILHKNVELLDFNVPLPDVVTIADEICAFGRSFSLLASRKGGVSIACRNIPVI